MKKILDRHFFFRKHREQLPYYLLSNKQESVINNKTHIRGVLNE